MQIEKHHIEKNVSVKKMHLCFLILDQKLEGFWILKKTWKPSKNIQSTTTPKNVFNTGVSVCVCVHMCVYTSTHLILYIYIFVNTYIFVHVRSRNVMGRSRQCCTPGSCHESEATPPLIQSSGSSKSDCTM